VIPMRCHERRTEAVAVRGSCKPNASVNGALKRHHLLSKNESRSQFI
jgi:hypothetical protein